MFNSPLDALLEGHVMIDADGAIVKGTPRSMEAGLEGIFFEAAGAATARAPATPPQVWFPQRPQPRRNRDLHRLALLCQGNKMQLSTPHTRGNVNRPEELDETPHVLIEMAEIWYSAGK